MSLSSPVFIFIFLPISIIGYYLLRKEFRNTFLLLFSLVFIAWGGIWSLVVLLVSIIMNYVAGLCLDKAILAKALTRKTVLVVSVISNLALLGFIKYSNFVLELVNRFALTKIPLFEIFFPIGVSFFTFSGLSYLFDIYQEKIQSQKNIVKFALYMALFFKLTQGPISRYKDINQQVESRASSIDDFTMGSFRFILGLTKKLAIADQLGLIVNSVFQNPPTSVTTGVSWMAAICYSLQIFIDFSGYSDMAIGIGKMFGFTLMENFKYPYIAKSLSEFWNRWHISLYQWFRDYLFYPLEYKWRKKKAFRVELNLLLVFLLTGLWHGASLHFVLWGLWHGLNLVLERIQLLQKIRSHLPKIINVAITLFVILFGWVLFRSKDVSYAINYFGVMFGFIESKWYATPLSLMINLKNVCLISIAALACVPWKDVLRKPLFQFTNSAWYPFVQGVVFIALLLISFILLMTSTSTSFLYFRF